MTEKLAILIVDDKHGTTLARIAKGVLGDRYQCPMIAENAKAAREHVADLRKLPPEQPRVCIVDLDMPTGEQPQRRGPEVGRSLAHEIAASAIGSGQRWLVIQCSGGVKRRASRGPDDCPVYFHPDRNRALFEKILGSLYGGELRFVEDDRGGWDEELGRLIEKVHSGRHDVISPFLAIDMDLQTLAGLLDRSAANSGMSADDEGLLGEVTRALNCNCREAPTEARSAWDKLLGVNDPDGKKASAYIAENSNAQTALDRAKSFLNKLQDHCSSIAGAANWKQVALEQSAAFQQDLIGLRDDLEAVVQYFEERLGNIGESAK